MQINLNTKTDAEIEALIEEWIKTMSDTYRAGAVFAASNIHKDIMQMKAFLRARKWETYFAKNGGNK